MQTDKNVSAVHTIFFDAVGTLIYPHPPVAEVYARVGSRWGAAVEPQEVARRFRAAFRRQDEYDRTLGYRTDEGREQQRWKAIVAEVFPELADVSDAYLELWNHFARPDAWACFPDVAPALEALSARGLRLGIASNFDARLRTIRAGLPALRLCQELILSTEIGWRKPAPEFFAALTGRTRQSAGEVLLVGDDWENDYQGGRAAGLQVVLLDREGSLAEIPAIRSLEELFRLFQEHRTGEG